MKAGSLGEIAVMKEFVSLGYNVFTSLTDNSPFDIIVEKDLQLFKVEVKSTSVIRNNKYKVQLKKVRPNRTSNKIIPFDSSSVDLLTVYIEPLDKVMIFKASSIKVTCELSIDV